MFSPWRVAQRLPRLLRLAAPGAVVICLPVYGIEITSRSQALTVLGLGADASAEQIKLKRNALLMGVHPDHAGRAGEARSKEVNLAYQYLSGKARVEPRSDAPRSDGPAFALDEDLVENAFGFATKFRLFDFEFEQILNRSGAYATFLTDLTQFLFERVLPTHGGPLRLDTFEWTPWSERPEVGRGDARYRESRLLGAMERSTNEVRVAGLTAEDLYRYESLEVGLIQFDVLWILVNYVRPTAGLGARVRLVSRLAPMLSYGEAGLLMRAYLDRGPGEPRRRRLRRQILLSPAVSAEQLGFLEFVGHAYLDIDDIRSRSGIDLFDVTWPMRLRAVLARLGDQSDRGCERLVRAFR